MPMMIKISFVFLFRFLLIVYGPAFYSGVACESPHFPTPISEVTALSDFFFSTNGPNWKINYGWNQLIEIANNSSLDPCNPPTWYGVTCVEDILNRSSHVKEINLKANNLVSSSFLSQSLSNLTYLEIIKFDENFLSGNISQLCELNSNMKQLSLIGNIIGGQIPSCISDKLIKVTELSLKGNNIIGAIPNSICKMTTLVTLGLENNRLGGPIPNCIGELSELNSLFLEQQSDYQSFWGTLPRSLCNLTNIEILNMVGNQISGPIPDCFGEKQHVLKDVVLNNMLLTGPIPESLCEASELVKLDLSYNPLTGPLLECIGFKLTHLTDLLLMNNNFKGTIPHSYCHLSKLRTLYILQNLGPTPSLNGNITGTIPKCLFNLTSLSELSFYRNKLSGSIPSSLCQLLLLNSLNLESNRLTGTLPECIGLLSDLNTVAITNNDMIGTIPLGICDLNKLQAINMDSNSFSGTIPSCIGTLKSITTFDLGSNQLTGPIPDSVCHWARLVHFTSENNMLTGPIPSCFGQLMPNINEFSLSLNKLTGPIPPSVCNMKSLMSFEVYDNKLSGEIPSCLGYSLFSVLTILLHNNNLEGLLPNMWRLPYLQVLYLSNNKRIHGELPASLFHQQVNVSGENIAVIRDNLVLGYVVIEGTSISGSIPSSVCKATVLKSLLLSGNLLTGSIPTCMTQLKSLETFHAPSNQLSGHLMKNMNNMSSLTHLDLSKNKLSGIVPKSLGDMSLQLIETKLYLNHLSCDLPNSVLQWKKSPDFDKFDILEGNWFSCPDKHLFSLSMTSSKSKGLAKANLDSATFYSCGGSNYVSPLTLSVSLLVFFVGIYSISIKYQFTGFHAKIRHFFFIINPRMFDDIHLKKAYHDLATLTIVLVSIGIISVVFFIPLILLSLHSSYTCQYMDKVSISGKNVGHNELMGVMVGVTLGVSCVLISYVFWKEKVMKLFDNDETVIDDNSDDDDEEEGGTISASRYESFLSDNSAVQLETLEEPLIDQETTHNDEDYLFKPPESRTRSVRLIIEEKIKNFKGRKGNNTQTSSSLFYHILEVIALLSFLTLSSIGPNVLLVFIVIGDYSSNVKILITLLVAFFKASLTSLIIPITSEMIANCLFPTSSWGYRFHAAVNIAVIVSSCSLVLAPILIVAVTDPRCLYYHFQPPNEVTADVTFIYCIDAEDSLLYDACVEFEAKTIPSSYKPHFEYDGTECISAFVSTYAPVFLTHVLLSTPISAAVELILVPLIAPWCFQNRYVNKWAGRMLFGLRAATFNTPCLLSITNPESLNEITKDVDLDQSARNIMKRAYVQFASSILLVTTFGLAAPVIGGASILAALIHFRHQILLLSQLFTLKELMQNSELFGVPNFKHCSSFPKFSSFFMVCVILFFWIFMIIDNFNESLVLFSTLIFWGIISGVGMLLVALKYLKQQLNKNNQFLPASTFGDDDNVAADVDDDDDDVGDNDVDNDVADDDDDDDDDDVDDGVDVEDDDDNDDDDDKNLAENTQ